MKGYTVQLGASCSLVVLLITKYGFEISDDAFAFDKKRLINQIWKLLPMREKEEDWQEHLKKIIIEISGLNEIFNEVNYIILLSNLEGLLINQEVPFEIYRKVVFDCISLLK